MFKSYTIDRNKIDKATFFKSLLKYFPETTTFYGGGTGLPVRVRATYETHEDEGMYIPSSQTDRSYRCVFSQALLDDLAGLLEKHNFEEILKYLYLYKGREPLLLWHNFVIDNKISISDSIPEDVVSEFAEKFGLEYCGLIHGDCCVCVRLPDIAVILMGDYKLYWEISETLEEVKSRGEPYGWVSAERCRGCGQLWLVGSEEMHLDMLCLRRLSPEEADRLLKENIWPPDFDKYTTLLRLGKEGGRIGGWIEGMDPSLSTIPWTIARLARESPGIHVSEIVGLLNLNISVAVKFAEQAVKEKGVIITFDETS